MNLGGSSLKELARFKDAKSKRISSYDRTGGNSDYFLIVPNEKRVLADIDGVGCINHIWTTVSCSDPYHLRKVILRMWWDGEKNPHTIFI